MSTFITRLLARVDEQSLITDAEFDEAIQIERPPTVGLIDMEIQREDKILAWATDQKTMLESEIASATERLREVCVSIEAHSAARARLEAGRQ